MKLSDACAALLLALPLLASRVQAAPSYPLVVVAVPDERADPTQGVVPLDSTQTDKMKMAYGSDDAKKTTKPVQLVRDVTGRNSATTPVIPYMGGYTTNLAPDADKAQTTYIEGVAMIKVGKLQWGITNSDTVVQFNVVPDNWDPNHPTPSVLIPRKNNTLLDDNGNQIAPGTYTINFNVSSQYDSWLRVENEYMQIISVGNPNPTTGAVQVTVDRHYAGTGNPNGHPINSPVFSPVYLGDNTGSDPRFTQSYPDNAPDKATNSTIRYAMDPGADDAVNFRIAIIDGYTTDTPPPDGTLKRKYDGAWWDTFNQVFFNLCDARGNPVRPAVPPTPPAVVRPVIWNFETGAEYTDEEFVQKLQQFTVLVRSNMATPASHGPYVLYANTGGTGTGYHLSGTEGVETLVDRPTISADNGRLDGACFEDSFLAYDGANAPNNFKPVVGTAWTGNLSKIIDAANDSRPYICMIGPAGDLAKKFNTEETNYFDDMRFGYASYLMAVKNVSATELPKNSTLSFGLPLLVSTDINGDAYMYRFQRMLFEQIGNPITPNNLTGTYNNNDALSTGLKKGSTGDANNVYLRKFQKGFVAVYPAATGSAVNITLPTPPSGLAWENADTGAAVTGSSVSLSPGKGLILVAK